jgi:hypothetical protein
VAWSIPSNAVSGTQIPAATTNAILADLTIIGGTQTAYTPTVTGITLGNGTVAGTFKQVDKEVDFEVVFTFGSTSALTAQPTFTLPATALKANWAVKANILDSSAAVYFDTVAIATSTTVVGAFTASTVAAGNYQTVISTRPMTWAVGDVLYIAGRYLAA